MTDNRIGNGLHALTTLNFPSMCNIIVDNATIERLLRYAGGSLQVAARGETACVSEPGVVSYGGAMVGQSSFLDICDLYQPIRLEIVSCLVGKHGFRRFSVARRGVLFEMWTLFPFNPRRRQYHAGVLLYPPLSSPPPSQPRKDREAHHSTTTK